MPHLVLPSRSGTSYVSGESQRTQGTIEHVKQALIGRHTHRDIATVQLDGHGIARRVPAHGGLRAERHMESLRCIAYKRLRKRLSPSRRRFMNTPEHGRVTVMLVYHIAIRLPLC